MNLLFAIPNVTVPNAAALSGLQNIAQLDDYASVFVATYGAEFQLVTQVAGLPALAANEVLASPVGGRVWQRVLNTQSPRWAQQIAWGIDTAAGNNENIGSVASPLQSWAEFRRRVPAPSLSMTVTIAAGSVFAATDPMVYAPTDRQSQAASILVTITGTRSRTALNNVVTSTNFVLATGMPPTIDLGQVLTPGTIIEATATGFTAVVMFLLAGTNYATTEWCDANAANQAPPAPGAAMALLSLPTSPLVGFSSGHVRFRVSNMQFTTVDPTLNRGLALQQCIFPCFVANVGSAGAGSAVGNGPPARYSFDGCSITGSGTNFAFVGMYIAALYLCGIFGKVTLSEGARLDGRRTIVSPSSTIGIDINDNAEWFGFNIGVFNTTTTAVDVHSGGKFKVFTPGYYGLAATNTGKGTRVREGSTFFNAVGTTPTLFSTGQELELENAAVANPVAAGLPVAQQPLVSWANLNAAPFGGNAMSYTTGAAVVSTNP